MTEAQIIARKEAKRRYRLKPNENAARRARYKQDSTKARAATARWRANNSVRIRDGVRQWRKNNPAKVLEYQVKARGRYKQTQENYRKSERGKQVRHKGWLAYYARKANAKGTTTLAQLEARWAFYGGRCYLCEDVATTTDHVIPLSRNGSHWPANLRPACKRCNSQKHSMTLIEYTQRLAAYED